MKSARDWALSLDARMEYGSEARFWSAAIRHHIVAVIEQAQRDALEEAAKKAETWQIDREKFVLAGPRAWAAEPQRIADAIRRILDERGRDEGEALHRDGQG